MEARFGKLTDAFLAGRGVVTDAESRWKLIEKASIDLSEAARKLARNAEGDYTPDDEYVRRQSSFGETPNQRRIEQVAQGARRGVAQGGAGL